MFVPVGVKASDNSAFPYDTLDNKLIFRFPHIFIGDYLADRLILYVVCSSNIQAGMGPRAIGKKSYSFTNPGSTLDQNYIARLDLMGHAIKVRENLSFPVAPNLRFFAHFLMAR